MTSRCDKSYMAQTHPCWHKVTPFDGIDSIHITVSFQYWPCTLPNSYREAILCVMCLSTIMPSPCYSDFQSVALLLASKFHSRVLYWNKYLCAIPTRKEIKRFWHKFQRVTAPNRKKIHTIANTLDAQGRYWVVKERIKTPSTHWR
jgi:hypothetical protein